ncbi:MAG: YrzE family protein [Bacteroidales bacterium]|nr:YrzE family protein [Bacteroidales bacterium]MCF8404727.1 YrzE family protein [Bacteroidales bacterium]
MKKFKFSSLKLPQSYYNYTSFIGSVIAIVGLFMFVFLFVISFFFAEGESYLGLFMWIVLPVFIVMGLLIIPVGMIRKHSRDKRLKIVSKKAWPEVNLNEPRTRNAFMIFGIGSLFFLLLSAVGSYEAFHYTESVEFCGTLCHDVMKPEYIAYHNSSHAKVACVECHVGSGASWYMRSKLSGLYQVYAVTTGIYPKPIPTPIHNLRPARETCEECHWPEKFYARQLVMNKHYLADENNTEWDISLQMKTGPAYSALGLEEGIHWHINPDIKVEYIATDSVRENIPWVRYTNLKTGEVKVFNDENGPIEVASHSVRKMDCMDCHNRPSHDYHTPIKFINNAITAGNIPKELPDIKSLSMEILSNKFTSTDTALMFIENEVTNYYKMNYEDIYTENIDLINRAIKGIQDEFGKNVFPEMGVTWAAYHNHIGHLEFEGCFRCHDNQHSTDQGEIIPMDCNLCHTIIAQGVPDTLQVGSIYKALEFVHPNDPYGDWKEGLCSECHYDLY